jgi:hypothetical protein
MPDSVSVTTSQSWFSRIIGSLVGIPVGLLIFAAAFPLLWWNEGRAVPRARSLAEGARVVVDVPADPVRPENEGKLVHLTAPATVLERVTDPDFGISADAIRLHRIAETYQWREHSSSTKHKRLGGGEETTTTYTYDKGWSTAHVNSSSFKSPGGHENPPALEWESRTTTAGQVRCGAFTLSPELVGKIGGETPRGVEDGDVDKMRARGFTTRQGDTFYKGNPASPQIGDVRVRFDVVGAQTVSVVAEQRGSTFETYQAKAGSGILLLETGSVPAEQMFKSAATANTILTWALRVGGLFAMFLGLVLVLRPISVLGSVVPILGSLLGAGTGFVAFSIAFTLSLVTIALAWFAYRPLLAGGLLAAAAAALFLLLRSRKKPTAAPPPVPPPLPPPLPPPIPHAQG